MTAMTGMPGYLALQVINSKKTYEEVIAKFPQYKEAIDAALAEEGYVVPEQ